MRAGRLVAAALAALGACATPPTPLERALASVDAAHIAADVEFLADDELAGRDSPSAGLRVAGNYLLTCLAGLGFEPGCASGWRHVFLLDSKRVDAARTRARWSDEQVDLVYARDFGVHPSDAVSRSTRGEVVFAGAGRSEDLGRCELAGRWALCVDQRYGRRRTLQRDLRRAGALGLICIGQADGEADGAPPHVFDLWQRTSEGLRPSRHVETSDEPFAALWLAPAARRRVEGLAVGALLAAELELEVSGGGALEVENLAALLRGSDPELAGELIVLSAHYDHVGTNRAGEVMNGADDNASGSAALVAVAEALAARGPLRRSVLLLWVGAEELGLLGSRAWCEAPDLPAGLRPVANVNLDMVGRNAPEFLELTPSSEHGAWGPLAERAWALAPSEGFPAPVSADKDFARSDQASFHGILGLPVVYLSTGEHGDYHQPGDDVERIDAHKIARVVRLVLRLLEEVQALDLSAPTPSEAPTTP